jgi:hypothetical protein
MTSKYMNFSPQLVNERNAALNNCPTKSGRSQIYKNYYIKMKDAYKKYEEAIEDDEEDYEEDDDDDEDYEPSEDEEYEEEYEASEADTSACETEDEDEADQDEEESACERKVPDQDANACETEADQEYCCCCEAAYACETEEASEAEASACETEEEACETEEEACETEEEACETEEADENEFGCPGCNYEWRDGYKNGWRDAMKYIAGRTHKEVPDTPACSYCDIVCKTRKCGGKCGGVVRYCSVDCQKQDWAFGHKNICCK